MTKTTFIQILGAASAAIGVLQAGIVTLPIDDQYKAFIVLGISVLSTFIAGLVRAPNGTTG